MKEKFILIKDNKQGLSNFKTYRKKNCQIDLWYTENEIKEIQVLFYGKHLFRGYQNGKTYREYRKQLDDGTIKCLTISDRETTYTQYDTDNTHMNDEIKNYSIKDRRAKTFKKFFNLYYK